MASPSQRRQSLLVCLGLAALVIAAYWPLHRFQFVNFDDNAYVTDNRQVQKGLTGSGLMWAFTTRHMGNWHPLTWLSHALDCELYGLKAGGHHLTSLFLHLANTLLVFGVFSQMTGRLWRSALVAALFGLHPLHVESVAWVAERKDVLSTLFFLLTLWAYGRYAQGRGSRVERPGTLCGSRLSSLATRHSSRYYVLALLFFVLGLMSKPMLVTLPFVLLLLDYWPLNRLRGDQWQVTSDKKEHPVTCHVSRVTSLVGEKVPFFALAGVASVVAYWAQQSGGSVMDMESLPLWDRMGNAVISYSRYLGKAVWPQGLAVFYPYHSWPMWGVTGAATFLAGVSAVVLWRMQREPWLAVGWFWFVGMLVPVIGLVQVGMQAMADRYAYIPLIGLTVMMVWGVAELCRNARRGLGIAVAAGCVVICGILSAIQVRVWKDSETLFRHALVVTSGNYLAHAGLGSALSQKGRIPEAIQHYELALELKPQHVWVRNNLGSALMRMGRVPEALDHLEEAVLAKPDFAGARYTLGNALVQAGRITEAITHLEQAVRLGPDFAEAHFSLGTALIQLGTRSGELGKVDSAFRDGHSAFEAAAGSLEQALRLNPDSADTHNHLGIALVGQGKVAEAMAHYERALQLRPGYADAHYNWGNALVRLGRVAEAMKQYQQALKFRPEDFKAHNNLGNVLFQQGRIQDAVSSYERALHLNPDYTEARRNLGMALKELEAYRAGRTERGIPEEARP